MSTIEKNLRKDLGRKGIESNAFKTNLERSHGLEKFYESESVEFEKIITLGNKKIKETIVKDLVYVKDPSDLIVHLCEERELVLQDAVVRIGIDGGQSSMKVVMNIFDPEHPERQDQDGQKYTGVNKMIVLALVRDIQETYSNLEIILAKARIHDLKYKLACDLKVLNILLGLSSHGGKHACNFCNGTVDSMGELRSIGSLKSSYQAYVDNGSIKKNMSDYDNVINKCLLEEEDEVIILDLVPISELHHMMKIVTSLSNILVKDNQVKELLKSLGVHWHGYNGGGLDGKNSDKVLKKLDQIEEFVIKFSAGYVPVVDALKCFREVVTACFGMKLDPEFKQKILNFNSIVEDLVIYLASEDFLAKTGESVNLSLGWKGHNIRFHLIDQLERTQHSLGIYSEQTSESAHKNMKKTLNRYLPSEDNPTHASCLFKGVSTYSSMRV